MIPFSFRSFASAVAILFLVGLPGTLSQAAPEATSLDGVLIEAVEQYPNQSKNELLLGFGLYPFNAYFNSFSFDFAYDYWISRSFTWELLNFNYLYSVNNNLTQQLANSWGVNPSKIDRPSYLASSNAILHFAYGKFVAFDQKVRYFRTSLLLGGGAVASGQRTQPTANVGLRFHCYVSNRFSWKLEARDAIAISTSIQNYVTFHLGGGFSF